MIIFLNLKFLEYVTSYRYILSNTSQYFNTEDEINVSINTIYNSCKGMRNSQFSNMLFCSPLNNTRNE